MAQADSPGTIVGDFPCREYGAESLDPEPAGGMIEFVPEEQGQIAGVRREIAAKNGCQSRQKIGEL